MHLIISLCYTDNILVLKIKENIVQDDNVTPSNQESEPTTSPELTPDVSPVTPEAPATPVAEPHVEASVPAVAPAASPETPAPSVEPATAAPVAPLVTPTTHAPGTKNYLVTLLLSIFLGNLGIDRFYLGHIGLGIAKLLLNWATLGIWWLVDVILIATRKVKNVTWDDQVAPQVPQNPQV